MDFQANLHFPSADRAAQATRSLQNDPRNLEAFGKAAYLQVFSFLCTCRSFDAGEKKGTSYSFHRICEGGAWLAEMDKHV